MAYNEEHGITPQSVRSAVRQLMEISRAPDEDGGRVTMTDDEKQMAIEQIEDEMLAAAANLDFEKAAKLRDQMLALKGERPVKTEEKSRQSRRKRKR